jgi:hypothetical protein
MVAVGGLVADGGLARTAGLVVVLAVSALAVLVPPRATAQETAAAQTADHDSKAPPEMDPAARPVEHDPAVFRPDPEYPEGSYDVDDQRAVYGGKSLVATARPLVEIGRPLYDRGPFEPSPTWLGEKNPVKPYLYVYGDLRTAAAYNDDGVADADGTTHQATVAARLNLEIDLGLTATERLHVFVRPFDKDGSFLRYDLGGKNEGFEERFDFNVENLFLEGDLGAIATGFSGRENTLDLPFAVGLVPMLTQNGIWLLDAFTGAAATVPAFSSRALDASNIDLTFFAAFDRVTTPAVPEDDARVYGMAGFVEANRGYWELGGAYVDDDGPAELSYVNLTAAFTRRYGVKLSNSVRAIANLGQDPAPGVEETADGWLVLIENSLITRKPYTLIPYFNLFAGFDRPQALARAAGTGGVLFNTGINFESDGLTGYPTLDDRGHDSFGGAVGVEYLFELDRQLVFEAAAVVRNPDTGAVDPGDEVALGVRFQQPIDNAWIVRADAMYGLRDDGEDPLGAPIARDDVYGVRLEIRRKF